MLVVDRDKFLKLPAGTFYCSGEKWDFGAIKIKYDNVGENDYQYLDISWIEGRSSDECYDLLEKMIREGISVPVQKGISRDGCFDDRELFLVYEKEDLEFLKDKINEAIEVS